MAFSTEQQAIQRAMDATQILITTPERPSLDAMAAACALGLFFRKYEKRFDLRIPGWNPDRYGRIIAPDLPVREEIPAVQPMHIKLNLEHTPLAELEYDANERELTITVIPKHGSWKPEDVRTESGSDRYDLVIACGVADMSSLGKLAEEQSAFLYRTPVINFDYQPTNENWGQINIVDLTSVSVTETVFHWLETWQNHPIDAQIATALLAGMIDETHSFRTTNVTPATLDASSRLMSLGGEREKIVHTLWRTRSVATLKLWGRVLSRLEQDRSKGFAWSILTESDILESGAPGDDIDGVFEELLAYAPEAKTVALIIMSGSDAQVSIHTQPPLSADELARAFGGRGTKEKASFILKSQGATFPETTQQIIEKLKTILGRILPNQQHPLS